MTLGSGRSPQLAKSYRRPVLPTRLARLHCNLFNLEPFQNGALSKRSKPRRCGASYKSRALFLVAWRKRMNLKPQRSKSTRAWAARLCAPAAVSTVAILAAAGQSPRMSVPVRYLAARHIDLKAAIGSLDSLERLVVSLLDSARVVSSKRTSSSRSGTRP